MFKQKSKLPVTVLSGFLGAGKTSVLTKLLQNTQGLRIAIIVNDMASVNIDALLVRDGAVEAVAASQELVSMSNGCICCTLREDLLREVSRLAQTGKFDYLLIESSGISEPLPVAQTFSFEDAKGKSLKKLVTLDTLVTVVDGTGLVPVLLGTSKVQASADPREALESGDLAQLLLDQVEWADVILVTRGDIMGHDEAHQVQALLKRLNPRARIQVISHGEVDPKTIMGTGLFNMESAESHEAWVQELATVHTPETEEYGIRSMVYQRREPFHPKRLHDFLSTKLDTVLRSKGYAWILGHDHLAWHIGKAGKSVIMDPAGYWWAAVPRNQWPKEKALQKEIESQFQGPQGDRRQELVLITKDGDLTELEKGLDSCLVRPGEKALAPNKDPFYEIISSLSKD